MDKYRVIYNEKIIAVDNPLYGHVNWNVIKKFDFFIDAVKFTRLLRKTPKVIIGLPIVEKI